MITSEKAWLEFLKEKPSWVGPEGKTILLSPHPDDETLSAGGLIADLCKKNKEVIVIAITDGESAYPKIKNLNKIRQQEQESALKLLGVSQENIIRFKLKDNALNLYETQLKRLLLPIIHKKDHILAPWIRDYHCDHEAVGRVALEVACQKKSYLSFYFFWTWHYSDITDINQFHLFLYHLDEETFKLKQQALNCYASQYSEKFGRAILPKHILLPTQRSFEVYYPYEY